MKKNALKTEHELTPKQRMFVEILVQEHGNITQAEALKRAGYESKSVETARSHASQLLNRKVNPHIARYYDKRFDQEVKKYESDNLRKQKKKNNMLLQSMLSTGLDNWLVLMLIEKKLQ